MMALFARLMGAMLTPIRSAIFWLGQLAPPLRRLGNISIPARIALLAFLFLLLTAVTFFLVGTVFHDGLVDHYYDRWWKPVLIIGLMIVIPVLVYFFVRKLLEGDVSRFPDIDAAWKAGLKALEEQGIPIDETPLFIVLGSPTPQFSTSLMQASRMGLNVNEAPTGPAPLHWYAHQDAIYLFCTDVSCLSRLADMADSIGAAPAAPSGPAGGFNPGGTIMAGGVPGGGAPAAGPGQTMVGGPSPSGAAPASNPHATIVGTPDGMPAAPANSGGGAPTPPSGNVGMGTIQFDAEKGLNEYIQSVDQAVAQGKPELKPGDVNLLNARMEHVCKLLRKARQPVCPMNGILALLPFRVVDQAPEQVQQVAQRDLRVLRESLMLRCPLITLVTDMDREPGFRELVRRVGAERAKENRFGKGYNVWNPPTDEQLEAVARHACGAFEDWTYMLFKEHDGLRKPGNTKLFGLLCKIRGSFTDSLANVLADGFGFKPDREFELGERQFMFGGCYFAATGQSEDRQAFVKSVLLKLSQTEGELDWNPEAIAEDERYQLGANLFTLLGLASILGLGGMIAWPWIKELSFVKDLLEKE